MSFIVGGAVSLGYDNSKREKYDKMMNDIKTAFNDAKEKQEAFNSEFTNYSSTLDQTTVNKLDLLNKTLEDAKMNISMLETKFMEND